MRWSDFIGMLVLFVTGLFLMAAAFFADSFVEGLTRIGAAVALVAEARMLAKRALNEGRVE